MINILYKSKILKSLRRWLAKKLREKRIGFSFYFDYRKDIYDKLLEIHESDRWVGGTMSEAYNLYVLTKNTLKLGGEIAEVGTGHGGHSTIICEAKGSKPLHLFDSFEGFVGQDANKKEMEFIKNKFGQVEETHKTDIVEIKKHFSQYPNVHIYKGWFPKTAEPIKKKKFCLVAMDVNIHKSTKDCLEFFYPRMINGGIIITHDYTLIPEVKRAYDEFSNKVKSPVIELNGSHALIVKK